MRKQKNAKTTGFTLIELMIVCAMVTTCIVAVGVVFSDSQKSWNATYRRAYCDVMLDSHIASKAFEASVRRATCERYLLDNTGRWIEVYYFADGTSPKLDRYAKLFTTGGTFYIEYGCLDPKQTYDVIPICENVTACTFSGAGRCIRMQMTLSDNNHDVSLIASAVPQNQ